MEDGEAVADGRFAIYGVTGNSSKIQLAFLTLSGSKKVPACNLTDILDGIMANCVDVGNLCVFVPASDLNVTRPLLADEIAALLLLLKRLDSIRDQTAVAMGISSNISEVSGSATMIAVV